MGRVYSGHFHKGSFIGWRSIAQMQFLSCSLSAQMQAPFGFYLLVLSTLKKIFLIDIREEGSGIGR